MESVLRAIVIAIYMALIGIVIFFPAAALFAQIAPAAALSHYWLYLRMENSLPPCLVLAIVYSIVSKAQRELESSGARTKREPSSEDDRSGIGKTMAKIGLSGLLFLGVATSICVYSLGTQRILMYAGRVKPYSIVFTEYSYQGLTEKTGSAKIICFGDSNSFHPPDMHMPFPRNSALHISGMLRDALIRRDMRPAPRVCEWSYAAASMFEYYCFYYKALGFSPDLIVIPVNWRVFGSPWINNRGFFFPELSGLAPLFDELPPDHISPVRAKRITLIEQLQYRISEYALFPIGIKAWVSEKVEALFNPHGSKDIPPDAERGAGDMTTTPAISGKDDSAPLKFGGFMADIATLGVTFPMRITEENPTFRDLQSLVYVVSRHETKVLFYIWPLDYEFMAEAGILDAPVLEESKQRIIEAVKGENIYLLDLSDLLEYGDFSDAEGHPTIQGRRKIADALAVEVLEIMGQETSSGN